MISLSHETILLTMLLKYIYWPSSTSIATISTDKASTIYLISDKCHHITAHFGTRSFEIFALHIIFSSCEGGCLRLIASSTCTVVISELILDVIQPRVNHLRFSSRQGATSSFVASEWIKATWFPVWRRHLSPKLRH